MSARKPPYFLCVVVIILTLVAVVSYFLSRSLAYTLHTASESYRLELADTAAVQSQGLGGRAHLDEHTGMLFMYTNATAERCFWMKDMRFALDIIWADNTKKVVHIARAVQPGSYPKKFCPGDPAQYVIELNAGQAARAGIHEGQKLHF